MAWHNSFHVQIWAPVGFGCGARATFTRTSAGKMQLRGKRPSSSAEKACERVSERLWPVPSGSVTFPFIQKAAHAKEKVRAGAEHFRRRARLASAGCRLERIIFRSAPILISTERCYIILMRVAHSPMCNSMSTWPVIKRRTRLNFR